MLCTQVFWMNHALRTLWPYYNKTVGKMALDMAKPMIEEQIKPVSRSSPQQTQHKAGSFQAGGTLVVKIGTNQSVTRLDQRLQLCLSSMLTRGGAQGWHWRAFGAGARFSALPRLQAMRHASLAGNPARTAGSFWGPERVQQGDFRGQPHRQTGAPRKPALCSTVQWPEVVPSVCHHGALQGLGFRVQGSGFRGR